MKQPENIEDQLDKRFEEAFAREFRPTMKRVIKPRTPGEVDAMDEGVQE